MAKLLPHSCDGAGDFAALRSGAFVSHDRHPVGRSRRGRPALMKAACEAVAASRPSQPPRNRPRGPRRAPCAHEKAAPSRAKGRLETSGRVGFSRRGAEGGEAPSSCPEFRDVNGAPLTSEDIRAFGGRFALRRRRPDQPGEFEAPRDPSGSILGSNSLIGWNFILSLAPSASEAPESLRRTHEIRRRLRALSRPEPKRPCRPLRLAPHSGRFGLRLNAR